MDFKIERSEWYKSILSICLWLPVKKTTDWMLDHADSELVSRMDLGKSTEFVTTNVTGAMREL